MRVTAELREVRRQMAIDFFRTVSSKDFKAEPGPFGIGFSHPLLQQLQHLCMHFPPNITYLTDGSGLDIVEPDKLKPHAQEVDMGKILASC
ncbi:MAG: hypothetical protein NT099_08720, partial [Candidatus Saganbacteria bacterium]|nr:hypothetical protein [Candidatus Saganbacteria bacterium]